MNGMIGRIAMIKPQTLRSTLQLEIVSRRLLPATLITPFRASSRNLMTFISKKKGKGVALDEDDRNSTTSSISTSSIQSLVYSDGLIDPELQEYLTDYHRKRNIRALSESYILKRSNTMSNSRLRLQIDTSVIIMTARRQSFRHGARFRGPENGEVTGHSENQLFGSEGQLEEPTPGSARRVSVFFEKLGLNRYSEPYPFSSWPRAMRISSAAGIANLDHSDGVNDSEPRLEESDIFSMDDLINNRRHGIRAGYVKSQEEKSKAVAGKRKSKSNGVVNGGCQPKLDRIGRQESGDDEDPGAEYNHSSGLKNSKVQNLGSSYPPTGTGGGGDSCQDAEVIEGIDADELFKPDEGFEAFFSQPSYGYPTPRMRQYGTGCNAFTWTSPAERSPLSPPFRSPGGQFYITQTVSDLPKSAYKASVRRREQFQTCQIDG